MKTILYEHFKDVSDDVDLRKCEHCQKEIHEGHVMYDGQFYLCVDCFGKFYSESIGELMYEHDQQYYTEWED